jgi:hypothetical protein
MAVEEKQVNNQPDSVPAGSAEEVPVLAVRDTVIFPGAMLPITVGRPSSVALVQSLGENRMLAVVSQIDPRVDAPAPEDLYQVGTICLMHKAIRVPKENLLLFCEGVARIRIRSFTSTEPFLKAQVERGPGQAVLRGPEQLVQRVHLGYFAAAGLPVLGLALQVAQLLLGRLPPRPLRFALGLRIPDPLQDLPSALGAGQSEHGAGCQDLHVLVELLET